MDKTLKKKNENKKENVGSSESQISIFSEMKKMRRYSVKLIVNLSFLASFGWTN